MHEAPPTPSVTHEVANALVGLHKEQFGRGPEKARSDFAGPDVLVTVLWEALLPAERALVDIGEHLRVMESRAFFQTATRQRFVETIEGIVGRRIKSFHSTCDPHTGIVMEIALFEPRAGADSED